MKKIILLGALLLPALGWSNQEHCEPLLNNLIDRLANIESELTEVQRDIFSQNNPAVLPSEVYQNLIPRIGDLQAQTNKLIEALGQPLSQNLFARVRQLESAIGGIRRSWRGYLEEAAQAPEPGKAYGTPRLEEYMEQPQLLEPEQVYLVATPGGDLEVVFSQSVIKVFHSHLSHHKELTKKFLHAISKGRIRCGTSLCGIAPLNLAKKDVYEVRIFGEHGGSRLMGFFDKDRFYSVVITSSHSRPRDFERLVEKVRRYRERLPL